MLPPAGQIFEKWHILEKLKGFSSLFLQLSRRVLAGVLPPAGQIFEKWHLLKNFVNFGELLMPLKQGSSRGAASGGSNF